MEWHNISVVSRQLNVSTRALRYYEQIGLIKPGRKEEYAYRVYDQATVQRLRQIVILRKLRFSLRQVEQILSSEGSAEAIAVFERRLADINEESHALDTLREILVELMDRLKLQGTSVLMLSDDDVRKFAGSLPVPEKNKEEKSMEDLNAANEKLNRISDREVRILRLAPMTVAAAQYTGDEPEYHAFQMIEQFMKKKNIAEVFPQTRCFGFNHPNPGILENGLYGYEFQLTIPDDMEVPLPCVKKKIAGGLYAAYMIWMDEIAGIGWDRLFKRWLNGHEVWEGNMSDSGENMNGLLEEHINILGWQSDQSNQQVDLLIPIKKKP